MSFFIRISAFLFLCSLLWLSNHSIVSTKLLELQLHVQKETLQNLEISSQVMELQLHRRFQGGEDDIDAEVAQYSLANNVFNKLNPETLEVLWLHRIGVATINSVRLLSFKPLLNLWQEHQLLLLLKYGFYLERNRRCNLAIQEYETFIKNTTVPTSNTMAFALLHQGYCHAMLGNTNTALEKASLVVEDFPGTHYSRTASMLLRLLTKRSILSAKIKKECFKTY